MKKETLTVEKNSNGTIRYRNADGKLHNSNGAAIIYSDRSKSYYINGKPLTEAEFKARQVQQTAPLHNTTATIDGAEYKLTAI